MNILANVVSASIWGSFCIESIKAGWINSVYEDGKYAATCAFRAFPELRET